MASIRAQGGELPSGMGRHSRCRRGLRFQQKVPGTYAKRVARRRRYRLAHGHETEQLEVGGGERVQIMLQVPAMDWTPQLSFRLRPCCCQPINQSDIWLIPLCSSFACRSFISTASRSVSTSPVRSSLPAAVPRTLMKRSRT